LSDTVTKQVRRRGVRCSKSHTARRKRRKSRLALSRLGRIVPARPMAKIRGVPTFDARWPRLRLRGTAPDRLGSEAVERDVLGRIQRVLELETVPVNREDCRLAPGDKLRPGAGFAARSVDQLRIFPRRAGRPNDRLGPGLDPADDLDAPMAEIGGN